MGIKTLEGIYLKQDFTEFITESFVKKYNINLSKWIAPFAYLEQYTQILYHNKKLPEGTYALIGSVEYPGKQRFTKHKIYQFNILKIKLDYIEIGNKFNNYIDLPITINPSFPLFRLDDAKKYKDILNLFNTIIKEDLTILQLKDKINKLDLSMESKLYRLQLAILTDMLKNTY